MPPAFDATSAPEPGTPEAPPFAVGATPAPIPVDPYGWFDLDAKEFVVARPDTPRAYLNYLTNGRLTAEVSHLGGGQLWVESQPTHPLLAAAPRDAHRLRQPGWAIYVRERESGRTTSLLPRPACGDLDGFECRHGLGRTTWEVESGPLAARLTVFLSPSRDALVWLLSLEHRGDAPAIYDVTYAVHLDASPDATVEVRYDPDGSLLVARPRPPRAPADGPDLYLATAYPPNGFDAMTEFFHGQWGSDEAPETVLAGTTHNYEATMGPASMVLRAEVVAPPGVAVRADAALGVVGGGQAALLEAARQTAADLRSGGRPDQWLEALTRWVADLLSAQQAEVPSPALECCFDAWTAWQTRIVARRRATLPRPERWQAIAPVAGATLDAARDVLLAPTGDEARDATAAWADPASLPWALDALHNHVAEFGADSLEASVRPMLAALLRAADDLGEHLGVRGLLPSPIGGDDVVASMQLAWGLHRGATAANELGDHVAAAHFEALRARLLAAIDQHAWTGVWYRDRCDPAGAPARAPTETAQQRLHLDAQTWAILSGAATLERGPALLHAVRARLTCDLGLRSFSPLHHQPRPTDPATHAPLGHLLNGGIDLRSLAWAIIATAALHDAPNAWALLRGAVFPERLPAADAHALEPYVWASWIEGPESLLPGRAHGSWITTTASWMQRAYFEHLLGIRAEPDGIRVDPVLPPDWREVVVRRRFRGVIHQFFIRNPRGETHGLRSLVVNGQRLGGSLIPWATHRTAREIEVML